MQPDLQFYGVILLFVLLWAGSEFLEFLARSSGH